MNDVNWWIGALLACVVLLVFILPFIVCLVAKAAGFGWSSGCRLGKQDDLSQRKNDEDEKV
jgi:hypothetical protein